MRLIIMSLATSLLVVHSIAKGTGSQYGFQKEENNVWIQGKEEEELPKWKHHPKFGHPQGHQLRDQDYSERAPTRFGIHKIQEESARVPSFNWDSLIQEEDTDDILGNEKESSFILDQIRNIKHQRSKQIEEGHGRNLQVLRFSPLVSGTQNILGSENIKGCIQQSGNKCSACNKQSKLYDNKCRCDFKYDLTSQVVSGAGVPDTNTYTVDSNAQFQSGSKAPRGTIFPCSNILRANFEGGQEKQQLKDDVQQLLCRITDLPSDNQWITQLTISNVAADLNNEFEAQNLAFELSRNTLNVVCTGDVKFTIASIAAPVPPVPSGGGGDVIPPVPAPSNETVIPGNETITPPSGGDVTPSNETVVPQNETVVPTNETVIPTDETVIPTNETIPSNETVIPIVPIDETVFPANETIVPTNETVVPTDETVIPTNETIIPSNETVIPTNETVIPTNETVIPTNETVIPTDETVIPTNETVIPTNETVIPTNETVIPSNETVIPEPNEIVIPSVTPPANPPFPPQESGESTLGYLNRIIDLWFPEFIGVLEPPASLVNRTDTGDFSQP